MNFLKEKKLFFSKFSKFDRNFVKVQVFPAKGDMEFLYGWKLYFFLVLEKSHAQLEFHTMNFLIFIEGVDFFYSR
jgi:hypothetical protein